MLEREITALLGAYVRIKGGANTSTVKMLLRDMDNSRKHLKNENEKTLLSATQEAVKTIRINFGEDSISDKEVTNLIFGHYKAYDYCINEAIIQNLRLYEKEINDKMEFTDPANRKGLYLKIYEKCKDYFGLIRLGGNYRESHEILRTIKFRASERGNL